VCSSKFGIQTGLPCEWKEERRDAMRVAAALDIPFLTFDFQDEYKKGVVDYMLDEYKKGRTPNPDVMCNKEIKFGSFLKKAREWAQILLPQGIMPRPPPAPSFY
jgi:tRNA U34 2-thiouridine synthase MnmA/TrmU